MLLTVPSFRTGRTLKNLTASHFKSITDTYLLARSEILFFLFFFTIIKINCIRVCMCVCVCDSESATGYYLNIQNKIEIEKLEIKIVKIILNDRESSEESVARALISFFFSFSNTFNVG